jgi:hypothetical protein
MTIDARALELKAHYDSLLTLSEIALDEYDLVLYTRGSTGAEIAEAYTEYERLRRKREEARQDYINYIEKGE